MKAIGWQSAPMLAVVAAAATLAVVSAACAPSVREGDAIEHPAPTDVYDPVEAGEALPAGYRQVLARDAIAPIYEPRFTSAGDAEYPEEALVLGVEIDGEARAYPISVLNFREMVIDRVADTPILATW